MSNVGHKPNQSQCVDILDAAYTIRCIHTKTNTYSGPKEYIYNKLGEQTKALKFVTIPVRSISEKVNPYQYEWDFISIVWVCVSVYVCVLYIFSFYNPIYTQFTRILLLPTSIILAIILTKYLL